MGKKCVLSDFESGMVVGAREAGLVISETADLLGYSQATISCIYREWCEKKKISREQVFVQKWHIYGRLVVTWLQ